MKHELEIVAPALEVIGRYLRPQEPLNSLKKNNPISILVHDGADVNVTSWATARVFPRMINESPATEIQLALVKPQFTWYVWYVLYEKFRSSAAQLPCLRQRNELQETIKIQVC